MNRRAIRTGSTILLSSLILCLLMGMVSSLEARGDRHHGHGFHSWSNHRHYSHVRPFYRGGFHPRIYIGFHHSRYWGGFYIGSRWFLGPTIVCAGIPYYYYNGEYYTPNGDELVAAIPPEMGSQLTEAAASSSAAQPSENDTTKSGSVAIGQPSDTVTVNIPNGSGSYSPVLLIKVENGYIGPQGEFYPENPTVAELQVLYGK